MSTPHDVTHAQPGSPPGWDYNPATWRQRLPIVGLAILGFLGAAYLALYQYRVVESVWEPFFGDGSETILNSKLSRVLPVSDAALGAFGYFADAVTGVIGGTQRWRTMPWIVIIFGIFVGPLGFVSVALVMAQPVMYDAWCTICLATAAISIIMIGPAMDEVLASLQYIRRTYDQRGRRAAWRAFWGMSHDEPVPLTQDGVASALRAGTPVLGAPSGKLPTSRGQGA